MSSVSEPMRPTYATGDFTVQAGGSPSSAFVVKVHSAEKSAASSSQNKTKKAPSSSKKASKSTRLGARRLMKAAYDPLRRAMGVRLRTKGGILGTRRAALGKASFADRIRRNATADEMALVASVEVEADHVAALEALLRESLQKYQAAMRQMEVRFEVLDRDLSLKKNRNPIHHIESRVKKPASIFEKLQRQGFPVSIESMEANLFDIAGVRIICSYVHDVYGLLDLLKKQDDLQIVTIKDYIATPKPNGYRSLHAIVRIPVYFMDKKEMVPVEVQLRTIAMDFWASLEHSLKYKAVREVQGIDASDELKDCSRIIEDVEARMQILARALEAED